MRGKSRYRRYLKALLLLLLHFAMVPGVRAEENLARIKADNILYDQERVIAKGHAVLTVEDLRLETDMLIYDLESGLVESQGDVVLYRPGEVSRARRIAYNVLLHKGELVSLEGRTKNIALAGHPIRGELYYKGKSLEMEGNILFLKEGNASTCDLPWPQKHYHLSAQEIKLIPGDKLIVTHGRLWIGKTPLWHVARMVIDLKPRVTKRHSYAPHFGYNKVDGFYVKTSTNYLAYGNNTGNLLFDYYQKTGFAAGVEHQFPIAKGGGGRFSYYHQHGSSFQNFTRQQLAASLQYDFGHGLSVSGNVTGFRFRVPPIISPDTYATQANLVKQGKRYFWSLSEFNNVTSGFSNSQVVQFHHQQDFGGDLRLDLTENFYKARLGPNTQGTLHNLTLLSKHFNGWSADLFFEKTNTSLFQGGFIDRTPEITLRSDVLNLTRYQIPYQLSMTLGQFFESFQRMRATRWDFQVSVPQHRMEFSDHFRLTTSALYRQDFYDTGNFFPTRNFHARYVLGSQTQLSARLWDHLEAVFDYRSQSHIGFDPLVYDLIQPYRALGGELSFHHRDLFRINVGTAYDYKNRFYQQLVTRLDLRPRSDWFFHADALYDPNSRQWQSLIGVADFRPFRDIRVQYWSSFSLRNGQIGYQDLAIHKEWHDWEARLVYRWHRQEVFLFFNLKAFPEQQVQLGINPILNIDPNFGNFEIR